MQTYQSMKDSGVAWLGDIPAEWEQKQARYIFKQAKESVGEDPSRYELLSLTLRGIIPRSQVDGGKNPENYDTYQIVHKNDLIMCLFDYDVTPRTVGRATTTGMVTGAYTNLRPLKGVSTRYYNYFFLSLDTTKELMHLCTGLRNGISKPTFFSLNLPVPSYETQEKIADYLDVETAKIDDLIAKQELMLKLLEEKRRATIGKAVTLGLDKKSSYKETNIPWLPNINSSWKMTPLKSLLIKSKNAIKTGPFGSDIKNSDYVSSDKGYARVYTQANIIKNNLDLNPVYISKDKYDSLSSCTIMPGDVVMTTRGTLGKSLIFTEGNELGILHPCLLRVQLNNKLLLPNFFQLLANDSGYFIEQLKYISNSTTIEVLYGNTLRDMKIALPTLTEQQDIVLQVEKINIRYQAAIKTINKQLQLLAERRASLIAHVVSGKVKI